MSVTDPSRTSLHWQRVLPAADWIAHYQGAWLPADFIAGLTLAAYLLPAGIGDASLAGLPPEAGLYACLFSGLVYWVLCSSRQTVVTVTSAISLLVGSTLGDWAGGDAHQFASLAATTAVLVGVIGFLAWLLKAGAIVRFISEGVMVGFKCGVALLLASTQLPKLFGFPGAHGDFWENSAHFFRHLPETNFTALASGVAALAVLVVGKIFFSRKPVAIFVVVGGILLSSWLDLQARGVRSLGPVPEGLPALRVPGIDRSQLNELFPLALACFLLGAVETAAIGRTFAAHHGGRFDANQEILAIAAANLAAGLGQGLPVSGGMSQSLVNEAGGAKTPLSGLIAVGLILLVVLFFSELLASLPQPVLAAIVLIAVTGLLEPSVLKQFWRTDRRELAVSLAALLGVLGSGLLRGVLIGAVLSLILLLRRAASPHVALLGRIPGSLRFSDYDRHPDNELIPGIVVCRPEASLLYFNIDHVCEQIDLRTKQAAPPPRLVVLDLSTSALVDWQAAHALGQLADDLHHAGIELQIVEARASVRDRLRRTASDGAPEPLNRHKTVADVVQSFLERSSPPDSNSVHSDPAQLNSPDDDRDHP